MLNSSNNIKERCKQFETSKCVESVDKRNNRRKALMPSNPPAAGKCPEAVNVGGENTLQNRKPELSQEGGYSVENLRNKLKLNLTCMPGDQTPYYKEFGEDSGSKELNPPGVKIKDQTESEDPQKLVHPTKNRVKGPKKAPPSGKKGRPQAVKFGAHRKEEKSELPQLPVTATENSKMKKIPHAKENGIKNRVAMFDALCKN